jgi:ferric-dicitrate binding protein FerR (iron transport regulator)
VAPMNKLFALGRHVARQEERFVDRGEHERLRAALVEHLAVTRAPRRVSSRFFLSLSVAALAVTVAAVLVVLRQPQRTLSFVVGKSGVAGTVGTFISAPDGSSVPVAFSDGTRVVLEPQARGRVVSVTAAGADLVVEAGRAKIAVVPRSGNHWEVSTGPFVVHVTGTRFDVEWHPDKDEFVLELFEGHVRISGCNLGEGHAVRAGERVEASCHRDEFRVSSLAAHVND